MLIPEITAPEAAVRLGAPQPPRLIDVREPAEWELCRLPGAELLPLSQFAALAAERLTDRAQPLLVYCHHGVRSARVTEFLLRSGFSDVTNLAGGIDAWSLEVDSGVPRY